MTFSTLSSRQAGIEQVMQVLRQAGRQNRGQAGRTGGWDRQIEIWSRGEAGRTGTLGRQDIEAASK
jgi:hypothetical protein